MIKKFLKSLGIGQPPAPSAATDVSYTPHGDPESNAMYNVLFCDNLALLRVEERLEDDPAWNTVLAPAPDLDTLARLAADPQQDSRAWMVAYNRLREHGRTVPAKQILGVILEQPLELGLEVIAGFADGRVHYLNQGGFGVVFDRYPPLIPPARELVALSQPLVDRLGPGINSGGRRPRATPRGSPCWYPTACTSATALTTDSRRTPWPGR